MPLEALIAALFADDDLDVDGAQERVRASVNESLRSEKRSCLDPAAITRAVRAAMTSAKSSSSTSPNSTTSASGSPWAPCRPRHR